MIWLYIKEIYERQREKLFRHKYLIWQNIIAALAFCSTPSTCDISSRRMSSRWPPLTCCYCHFIICSVTVFFFFFLTPIHLSVPAALTPSQLEVAALGCRPRSRLPWLEALMLLLFQALWCHLKEGPALIPGAVSQSQGEGGREGRREEGRMRGDSVKKRYRASKTTMVVQCLLSMLSPGKCESVHAVENSNTCDSQ